MAAGAPTPDSIWAGRTVVIATQHEKERVLGPLLRFHLGLPWRVPENINTDQFGTFSGEVERVDDPVTTLRKKIRAALDATGETLGLGSEGSFGPHPEFPWVPGDQEIVMWLDLENNQEVIELVTSTDTNYHSSVVSDWVQLEHFAHEAKFPSHGLIIKKMDGEQIRHLHKGITNWGLLRTLFDQYGSLHVETDMRANFNPTRMQVIELAARKLFARLQTRCPQCRWPGFGETNWLAGLPCENCGRPTRLPKVKITSCSQCGFCQEEPAADPLASAQFCDFCNP